MSARLRVYYTLFLGATTLTLVGCPPTPREPATLIDHGEWSDVSNQGHPFSDREPTLEDQVCEELAVFRELFGAEDTLTIDLDGCNSVTLSQSTRTDVLPGEIITFRLWRDAALFANDEPMEVALRIGEDVIWDQSFPAPGDSGLVFEEFALPNEREDSLPAGTSIHFFVNSHRDLGARHGGNSLNLIELSRRDPTWEEEG